MIPLRRRLLGLSPLEVTFAQRGFRGGHGPLRDHLEMVGSSFLAGYHTALEERQLADLAVRLRCLEPALQGFAFEGAAMALTLLDTISPWRHNRWRALVEGAADPHSYMAHVGAGWAIARLPFGSGAILRRLDPLLRWLAFDGYGFHQGYFHWRQAVEGQQRVPRRIRGYARHAFDQGLGRSLWFVEGADVARIPRTIATFPEPRRADLWAGIGLASTYAGGVDESDLEHLLKAAANYFPQLVQGALFAAEARQRAGNPTPYTELACRVFCSSTSAQAAELARRAGQSLPADAELPAYEIWRQRAQALALDHRPAAMVGSPRAAEAR